MTEEQFMLSIIVHNRFGALSRIAGLFARRGFNIDRLNVAETVNPKFSHMTIVLKGDDYTKNQIVRQLDKLYDVIKVELVVL